MAWWLPCLKLYHIVWWVIRYIWQHIFHSSTFSLKRYRNWRKWNENLRERTNNVLPRNINIPPTAALRSCVMVHNLISSWHVSLFCFCFDFVFFDKREYPVFNMHLSLWYNQLPWTKKFELFLGHSKISQCLYYKQPLYQGFEIYSNTLRYCKNFMRFCCAN